MFWKKENQIDWGGEVGAGGKEHRVKGKSKRWVLGFWFKQNEMVTIRKEADWRWKDDWNFFFGYIKFEMFIRQARRSMVGSWIYRSGTQFQAGIVCKGEKGRERREEKRAHLTLRGGQRRRRSELRGKAEHDLSSTVFQTPTSNVYTIIIPKQPIRYPFPMLLLEEILGFACEALTRYAYLF